MCCISAHGLMLSQAACACIAELGAKIDKKAVQPYVSTLLAALIESFHDHFLCQMQKHYQQLLHHKSMEIVSQEQNS